MTTSTAANEMSIYGQQSTQISPIRFYFEEYTIFLNIKPVDKAFCIATDICLGSKQSIGLYNDSLNMRATDNRKYISLILWVSNHLILISQIK